MNVALIADGAALAAAGVAPDLDLTPTADAVEAVLRADGHAVTRVTVARDGAWLVALRALAPDLVFNLCEGVGGVASGEAAVIGALELLGIPHTGSTAWTAALCLRKAVVNAILARAGLPVPPWALVRHGEGAPAGVEFPAVVKPAAEDASLGVDQGAVVGDAAALAARLAWVAGEWGDALVQRYVPGREVNVGVLGRRVLPASEIDFSELPRGMWPIVTYRSKWEGGSDEDRGTRPVCPAPLAAPLAAELAALALAAWQAVGGGSYGRVDFRVDAGGRPWVLEVNPNPDLAPDAGLARMAAADGVDYAALVRRLCADGVARGAPLRPHAAGVA